MAITAAMVKELREMTGAGMMDCKKALAATEGNMEAAVDFLREKGLATAQKKASRIAAEGIVATALSEDGKKAVAVEVNAETDFVAKNEKFRTYVADVAAQALNTTAADIDAFMAEPWALDTTKTVAEELSSKISIIGEKLSIRRFAQVNAEGGCVVAYTHGGGRIGVLVEAETEVVNDEVKEALKNIAMQIAAANPSYLNESDVPEDVLAKEKEIVLAQMANDPKTANKPDAIKEKMAIGKLGKFYKEACLVDQAFIKDGGMDVKKYVADTAKALGGDIKIASFTHFTKGEGLEKRNEDFAAEVAAAIKG